MLKILKESSEPWYKDGLHFKCTECGQCCTGAPGYIWVTEEEMKEIADHLKVTLEEFIRMYVRRVNKRYSLLERPKTYDCVFLNGKKCQIYSVRPIQCRTFPWWPGHLKSREDWQEAAKYCEGINDNAPIVPYETIEEQKKLMD